MTNHLVGAAEVGRMLGVSRQRVTQIAAAYSDFPEPEVVLSSGRVWSRAAVQTWIEVHSDRGPGKRLIRGLKAGPEISPRQPLP